MKEFFRHKSAIVYYDESRNALFLKYLGKVYGDDQFIEINTAVIDAFKQLSTNKFVADIRDMGVISLNSQKWVIENLFPSLVGHLNGQKLYHVQLLDPSEVFAKVSGTNIRNKSADVQEGFEVHQVTSEDELDEYLTSIDL